MPSVELGNVGYKIMKFELELHDIEATVEPKPSLKITTRWTPAHPPQPIVPSQQADSHLVLRYPSLRLVYLPGGSSGAALQRPSRLTTVISGDGNHFKDGHEIGVAELDVEETQHSPSWFAATGLHQKTVKFRMVIDLAVLERVEQGRSGLDFVLRIVPHGEVEERSYQAAGHVNSYWLTDSTGINLEFPRSRWGDILQAIGYPSLGVTLELPLTTPAAKAAQVHLREALRQFNVDNLADAVVNARRALEELRGAIPPIRPRPKDDDYRNEDAATRIRRAAWAAFNLCNITAHKAGAKALGRAEALLAIQQVGALMNYAGADESSRKIALSAESTIPTTTIDADYEDAAIPRAASTPSSLGT